MNGYDHTQTPLPGSAARSKTPASSSSTLPGSALTRLDLSFEGQPVTAIWYQGQPCWPAVEIGRACGYGRRGRTVTGTISSMSQEGLLRPGHDHMLVTQADVGDTFNVSGGKMTLLTETGVFALLLHSRKPKARAVQLWLRDEVLPQLARDGRYSPDRTVVDGALVEPAIKDAPPIHADGAPKKKSGSGNSPTELDEDSTAIRRRAVERLEDAADLAEANGAPWTVRFDLALAVASVATDGPSETRDQALARVNAHRQRPVDFDDEETVERRPTAAPSMTASMVTAAGDLIDEARAPANDPLANATGELRRIHDGVLDELATTPRQTRYELIRALRVENRFLLFSVVRALLDAGDLLEEEGPGKAHILSLA